MPRNSQLLARATLFFGLFHDLLELRIELVSDRGGGEVGRETSTADSSDISEAILFLWYRLGMLPFRSRRDENRRVSGSLGGGETGSSGVISLGVGTTGAAGACTGVGSVG